MTLQDFFISGLPTNNETRSRKSTMVTNGDQTDNRLKVEPRVTRPSIATQKSPIPKRILFFQEIILMKISNFF
jgi:hypothetical protein